MRRIPIGIIIGLALGLPGGFYARPVVHPSSIDVHFSPRGGATAAIVASIDGARQHVRLVAFSFTSDPIAESLIRAKKRGVDVVVIADSAQKTARSSVIYILTENGIPVYLDNRHSIQHNKYVTIDFEWLVNGSFNFTDSAENRNAENLLRLKSKEIVAQYNDNFQTHLEHAIILSE